LPLRPRRHRPALPPLPGAPDGEVHRVRAGSSGSRPGERGEGRGSLSTNQGPAIAPAGRFPQFDFRAPLTPPTLEVFRGSTAYPGARQALLLPPLRADFRALAGARDGRDPRPRGPEVCLPELLLFADDSRGFLRRSPVRSDGGRFPSRTRFLQPGLLGPRHAARPLARVTTRSV